MAVACLMTPMATAGLPLKRDHARSSSAPSSAWPTSPSRTEIAVGLLDDHVVELLRRAQVGLGEHGELALLALDAARRHLDVLAPERVLDVLRRQLVGGEALRIEPDAHRIFALAEETHVGHAGQRRAADP